MPLHKALMAHRVYILSLPIVVAALAAILFIQLAIEGNDNNKQTLGQTLVSNIYAAGGGKQEQISGQNHQQYLPVVENNLVPVQNTKDIALPFVSTTNQATKNL